MRRSPTDGALAELIETLIDCADGPLRDRILLEAVLSSGAAAAASLWKLLPPGSRDGHEPVWTPVLRRGPRDLLPTDSEVQTHLEGRPSFELRSGQRVVPATGGLQALVLGGAGGAEAEGDLAEDLIEALLEVWAATEGPADPTEDAQEGIPAPLPGDARGVWPTAPPELRPLLHDLRNLMTGIRTNLELEEPGEKPGSLRHALVDRECQRAGSLLLECLDDRDQKNSDAGGLTGSGTGCLPRPVLVDAVASEQGACRRAGIELHADLPPGLDALRVPLDEVALDRVARNLLINAREALEARRGAGSPDSASPGRPGGRVQLECRPARGGPEGHPGVRLSVRDDGPGFPPELLGSLFEAGKSTKGSPGRGQGLRGLWELLESAGGLASVSYTHLTLPTIYSV